MLITLLIFTAVLAYVAGGVNGAITISKFFYRKDIRQFGSGNPGLTNFYRVFGKGGAALVVLIDVVKTIAPVIVGGYLFARLLPAETFPSGVRGFLNLSFFGSQWSGFFVMMGHCYPLFHHFRGGKGVMAMGTIVFFIDWRVALACWGVFVLMVLSTRFVSLGSVVGVVAYPVMVGLLGFGGVWEILVAAACAVLLIARHGETSKGSAKGRSRNFRSAGRKKRKERRASDENYGIRQRRLGYGRLEGAV